MRHKAHLSPSEPSHPFHMKQSRSLLALVAATAFLAWGAVAQAQVPQLINYQGRVVLAGTNFNSPPSGLFKFALVQAAGPTLVWKSDGSAGNTEPASAVSLKVANGLYSVLLGDTNVPNMVALPSTVFTNSDIRLRVWFNGGSGFQQLSPDQRIASVGYAMIAGTVPDGVITGAKLADGTVTASKLAPGAVTSAALGDSVDLGATNINGLLNVYRTTAGTPAIKLDGTGNQISVFGDDGLEQARLWGPSYGELLLNNSLPGNATAVRLTAQGATGGQLDLNNTNGNVRARLEGENIGGTLTLMQADGSIGAILSGNEGLGSGALSLRNTNGSPRFRAFGGPSAGSFSTLNETGTETIAANGAGNGAITLRQADGSVGLNLMASNGTGGGGVTVSRDDGTFAGQLTVANTTHDDGFLGLANRSGATRFYARASNPSDSQGGYVGLRDAAGVQTITLDASQSGSGRITTQVLSITGGSDLSENFDVRSDAEAPQPGMIVSIDPKNPGELALCRTAHDKRVAGIISGAGGVRTGMLMGQSGTKADGKHAVALTGRVYCYVDADAAGPVEPGDLITTSNTPGHGMRVRDHALASGAIIGKAMTSLDKGKGLVLILVSLQ